MAKPKADPRRWLPLIQDAAEKYDVPAELLWSQMLRESGGDPNARGKRGEYGLLQLMPNTAAELGLKKPLDPAANIDAGARYMRQMLDHPAVNGDERTALIAYNWGPGNLSRNGVARAPLSSREYADTIQRGAQQGLPGPLENPQTSAPPARATKMAAADEPQGGSGSGGGSGAMPDSGISFPTYPKAQAADLPVGNVPPAQMPAYFGQAQQKETAAAQTAADKKQADADAAATSTADRFDAARRMQHVWPSISAWQEEHALAVADPNYVRPSPKQVALDLQNANVPLEYMPRMDEALSTDHYNRILANLQQENEALTTLSHGGTLSTLGLNMAGALSDPVTAALQLTPYGWARDAKALEAAVKAGTATKLLRSTATLKGAAIGTAVGLPTELSHLATQETAKLDTSLENIWQQSLMGAAFGRAFGGAEYSRLRPLEMEAAKAHEATRDLLRSGGGDAPYVVLNPGDVKVRDPEIGPLVPETEDPVKVPSAGAWGRAREAMRYLQEGPEQLGLHLPTPMEGKQLDLGLQEMPGTQLRLPEPPAAEPAAPEFNDAQGLLPLQGHPAQTYYHGTPHKFDQFELGKPRSTLAFPDAEGLYFSKNSGDAESYAGQGGHVIPAELGLKNPYHWPEGGTPPAYITKEKRTELEAQGHDGIIYKGGQEAVVFKPEQIKRLDQEAEVNKPPEAPASAVTVINAMRGVNSQAARGALVYMQDLRASLRGTYPTKQAFDTEIMDLAERGVLQLQMHAWPGRLTDAEKEQLIATPAGGLRRPGWFDSIGVRIEKPEVAALLHDKPASPTTHIEKKGAQEEVVTAMANKEKPLAPDSLKEGTVVMWTGKDGKELSGTVEKVLENGSYMVRAEGAGMKRVSPGDVTGGLDENGSPFLAEGSIGAAQADRTSVYSQNPIHADLDKVLEDGKELPSSWGPKVLRWDPIGWLKNQDNGIMKWFGHHAGEDGVGINADGSAAHQSVEEYAEMLKARSHSAWLRSANHAFAEHDAGQPFLGQSGRRSAFMEEAGRMYEGHEDPANMSPAMANMVKATRKYFDDFKNEMLSSDLAYARGMDKGTKAYLPHIIDPWKFAQSIERFGINEVSHTLYESLLRRAMHIADLTGSPVDDGLKTILRYMADGYVNGVQHRGTIGEIVGTHGFRLDARPEIEQLLRQSGKVSEDRIRELLDELRKSTSGDTGPARFRHRYDFDMGYSRVAKEQTGAAGTLKMTDLFERNLDRLVPSYGRQTAGHIAFSKVMGIKSRDDYMLVRAKALHPTSSALSKSELERGAKYMDYMYDAVTGHPLEDHPSATFNIWSRRLRDFNFMRTMNQVGFTQATDTGRMLAQVGMPALMKQMPVFAEIAGLAKDGKLSNQLLRELEAVSGIGTFRLRNQVFTGRTGEGELMGGKFDEIMHAGKNLTANVSGLNALTVIQQRMAAAGMAQRLADMVSKGTFTETFFKNDARELASLGITRDMASRINTELKANAKFGAGARLHQLNLEKWGDQDAANALTMGLHRAARRLVQENSYGTSNPLMHTVVGKLMFQFRSFMFNAWTKQTLHGIAMHDIANTMGFLLSTTIGGLAYMLQQTLNEPDPDKLEKNLHPVKVALAGFNRSGYSSLVPTTVDTAIGLGSGGSMSGLFTHGRSSELATGALAGNPTVDLGNSIQRGVFGSLNALARDDYDFSQQDARGLARALPFSNVLGVRRGLAVLMQDLPKSSGYTPNQNMFDTLFPQ